MTLIVGIKCKDAVVLGADGAATFGAMGQMTIRLPVRKKLKTIASSIVIGTCGQVGLGQRLAGSIERLREQGALYKNPQLAQGAMYRPFEVMRVLRQVFWQDIEMEGNVARAAQQMFGPFALQNAISSTVVALMVDSQPCLMQFDQSASPEEVTEDLPFVALGSGQMIADPFLALIQRLFWPDRLPSLEEGKFAVYWTLHHAILTHPGGVADPKQIVVLGKRNAAQWGTTELTDAEMKEYEEHVNSAEKAIKDFDRQAATVAPPDYKPA
jgi:20S proteasome alpha/beta subunit